MSPFSDPGRAHGADQFRPIGVPERADYGTSRSGVKPSSKPGRRIGHTSGTSTAHRRPSGVRFVFVGLWFAGRGEQRRRAATFVVRDAESFERVWTEVFGGRREVPAVDFSQHMVAIATMGVRPTTGYAIEITGVRASRDGGVTVQVKTTSPGAGCVLAQVLTMPVDASRLHRTDGAVRFEFTRATRDCAGR